MALQLALAWGAAGVAVASTPKHHKPDPDVALARAVLLRQSDLGSSWKAAAAPKKVPTLTCPTFTPDVTSLPKPGGAVSQTFRQTANGPFVSQSAYVFPKQSAALTYWQRVVRKRLVTCVADSLTASSTQTVSFSVTSKRSLSLPAIGDRRAGYRVVGTATTSLQKITVYLDMIVVGHGDGVTQVSFTSFSEPPARSLELRLSRLVAGRLPPVDVARRG